MRASSWQPALRRLGVFLLMMIPAAVLAYAIMGLLWPWSVLSPLNPLKALTYFSHFFEQPWKELFAGQLIAVPDMPVRYLPQLFAMKLPEVMFILGLTGTLGAFAFVARPDMPPARRASLLLLALAALVPIAIALITRPALYNGVRHFLFVVPPFAALGGIAAAWIAEWLATQGRRALVAGAALLVAGVLLPIIDMIRLHPYQYVHFNIAAGGVKHASGRFMLDYWGLAFKQTGNALREKVGDAMPKDKDKWVVVVCGPHPPARIALGEAFEVTSKPQEADFAMFLGAFYCRRLDAPVIAEIRREDVVFGRVYDLRGRNIPYALTPPPAPEP